ncbi:hypothetical protein FRC11_001033, partial [Ceratobasidium sp. 423]
LSPFALQCIKIMGHQSKGFGSFGSSSPPALSDVSTLSSNLSTITSNITTVPKPTPNEYERISYYNGITRNGDHLELVYHLDFHTKLFPRPASRWFNLPVKSLHGVYDTLLNGVWDTLSPKIHDLIKAQGIKWTSIDPAHFFTHGLLGEEDKGSLGPIVIWVSVHPGSTSSDTAHAVSQDILELLWKNQVKDAVVKWQEAILQKLAGPPLMCHISSNNATHHICHFLTPLLSIPLVTEETRKDAQDWAVFLVAEAKVRHEFEGNVIDLRSKFSVPELTEMFYACNDIPTTFKFPDNRKLWIKGYTMKEDLTNPTQADSKGQHYLVVSKDGNSTDLTFRHYARLVSFTLNEVGIESIELSIYNSSFKGTKPFSAKGDLGSLVWCMKNGKAFIIGQLHSGHNKGGLTSNHVSYCTPSWYLLEQIKKKFKHADFYHKTW